MARSVIKNCYVLNNSTFCRFGDLWKKICRQRSENIDLNDTIAEFVKLYTNMNFTHNHFYNLFEDISYKNFKKFKKMVNNRFESMSDFCQHRYRVIVITISEAAQQIYNEFQQICLIIQSGNIDHNLINQFAIKFSHFILFGSNTLNTSTSGKGYFYNTPDQEENQNFIQQKQGMIWAQIFNILKDISNLHSYIDNNIAKNMEMSILYFLEFFSNMGLDDLHYSTGPEEQITTSNKIFNFTISMVNGLFSSIESFH